MTDKRDINALRYYVERLEDELAEEERQHAETTLKLEKAREHISKQALDIATLGQEVGRLLENAKQDAGYLAACHYWCQQHGCAPSSSDLISARAALAEKEEK